MRRARRIIGASCCRPNTLLAALLLLGKYPTKGAENPGALFSPILFANLE
jgi:hypothetical protein